MSYIWPIGLVVLSNVVYQICAKSVPDGMNPFASLVITYFVGAAASLVLYFATAGKTADLSKEFSQMNWAPFVLGIVIVGLEVGFIYAYKAGWQVSTASLVQGAALAVILLFVGYFIYKEAMTWNKLVGAALCLSGLFFINYHF